MSTEFRPASFDEYATEAVPQAAAGSAGKNGILEATFAADSTGQTRLVRDYAKVPFHVTGDLSHDQELPELASLFVQSPTGGIAQGDRHSMDVEVGADAKAHVTTQSATQVLGMERNYGRSDVTISVDDGGYVEFLPEPVILFRDSRLLQRVDIELGEDATAVFGETVVPGRLARGEAFDYDRYYSRITAWDGRDDGDSADGGRRLFEDVVHLAGKDAVQGPGVFGDYRVLGNLYVVGTGFDEGEAAELSDRLHERVAGDGDEETEALASASTLPRERGVVVRALGPRTDTVTTALAAAWDETRQARFGVSAPESRKL
ncbi:urease accessory protein [Halogranum gelatinilyticum]|uniref:Urease accessory protein UreD n=1 Tax=Halogranum gelatinilyticum TaxID=660521 RepID=A0A1G9XHL6_9EURY|nr:urease accessory protein UreD [Halogranum gelatinilyticum]SDM96309.1 urease accessory protein [Halogranum gelatinilyticum]